MSRINQTEPQILAKPDAAYASLLCLVLATSCTTLGGDGEVTDASAAATVRIAASKDAEVRANSPASNFGALTTMRADKEPQAEFYVQFASEVIPADAVIHSAVLRLYATNNSWNGPSVYQGPNQWSETSITWNNKPGTLGSSLGVLSGSKHNQWLELDVTSAITPGEPIAFAVIPGTRDDGLVVQTREASNYRPELVVKYEEVASEDTFIANADAEVRRDSPHANYGLSPKLAADNYPVVHGFVRFSIANATDRTIARATLRCLTSNGSPNGPQVFLADSNWNENEITWNNAPSVQGGALTNLAQVAKDQWLEIDVTSAVTGNGNYTFALIADSGDSIVCATRETSTPPELVVQYGDQESPADEESPSEGSESGPEISTGFYNGMSLGNDEAFIDLVGEFPVTHASSYYNVGQISNFPNPRDKQRVANGTTLLLGMASKNYQGGGADSFMAWKDIAAGKHDAEILVWGDNLAALNTEVWLAFDIEPDVKLTQGLVPTTWTPAEFAGAAKRISNLVKSRAPKVKFTFWVGGYQKTLIDGMYPGDDVVDIICWDPYVHENKSPDISPESLWGGFKTWLGGRTWGKGKTIGLCETGFHNGYPDEKGAAFWNKAPAAARNLGLSFITYFHRNSGPNGHYTMENMPLTRAAYVNAMRALHP